MFFSWKKNIISFSTPKKNGALKSCRFGPQKVDIRTDLLVAVLCVVFMDPQSVFFGEKTSAVLKGWSDLWELGLIL